MFIYISIFMYFFYIKGAPAFFNMNFSETAVGSLLLCMNDYLWENGFGWVWMCEEKYIYIGVWMWVCSPLYTCPFNIYLFYYHAWACGQDPPILFPFRFYLFLNRSVFISTRLLCWVPHWGRLLGTPKSWALTGTGGALLPLCTPWV